MTWFPENVKTQHQIFERRHRRCGSFPISGHGRIRVDLLRGLKKSSRFRGIRHIAITVCYALDYDSAERVGGAVYGYGDDPL